MKKKILMIDDDEDLCEEMAEILKDEGYNVDVAFDGVQGKKLIDTIKYSLYLLDIKMPGISGLDILKYLKEKKIHAKVIVISGNSIISKLLKKEENRAENGEKDILKLADAVISKPFDVDAVLRKIETLIG